MGVISVVDLRCEYKKNPIGIDVLTPRISWKIESDQRNVCQKYYEINVSKDDPTFAFPVWNTGKVESEETAHIEYQGPALCPGTTYYYRVRSWDQNGNVSGWSSAAFWEMGLLRPEEWTGDWIASPTHHSSAENEACPLFRKTFEVTKKVKRARIYATALGLYELCLNGKHVGEDYFTPGWTSYSHWLQYQTYDVTEQLQEGRNAIGIILGNGWYRGEFTWEHKRNIYGDRIAALLQLHITYEDGSQCIIASDSDWRTSTGPILKSEIYDGEIYDARLEKDGWCTGGYADHDWQKVETVNQSKDILVSQVNVPVRRIQEIKPIQILHTPLGETVIDMGQNMVGWIRFKAVGNAGSKVILQHAEVLDKDGNFYFDNIRKAQQRIEYTLKGKDTEVFEPHFTYQGFRYVKVIEFPRDISLDSITGIVVHSDMEQTGSFTCSDQLINQLQHNILWGQKGNFLDVPTDCPQRDERLGWTGDAQVFIRTSCFNMNTAPFFTKWLRDVRADQYSNGAVPFVVPDVLPRNWRFLGDWGIESVSAAWGDAAIICPWTLYLCYGDKRILKDSYNSMKAWVEYVRRDGENEFLWETGPQLGDWLGLDAEEGSYVGATPKEFVATAFYAYSTALLIKTAELLGCEADVKEYTELYKNILKEFKKENFTSEGEIKSATQTAYVLALMFELVEGEEKEKAMNGLIRMLEEKQYHLTTGFVGTPYLCHALSRNGRSDAAYKLLLQRDFPSWLYQIEKGATTIWEHWDGIKEYGSFWSVNMNSFNHYAYGSIGDWLYRAVAGIEIDPDKPGYKHIMFKPYPHVSLNYVDCSYESIRGKIQSKWSRESDRFIMDIAIPANSYGTVYVPADEFSQISEGGRQIELNKEIKFLGLADGYAEFETGSGKYHFEVKL